MFSRSHVLTRRNEHDGTQKEDTMENRTQPRRACTVRAESNRVNLDPSRSFLDPNESLRGLNRCMQRSMLLQRSTQFVESFAHNKSILESTHHIFIFIILETCNTKSLFEQTECSTNQSAQIKLVTAPIVSILANVNRHHPIRAPPQLFQRS